MTKNAFRLSGLLDYGMLISYCIDQHIDVSQAHFNKIYNCDVVYYIDYPNQTLKSLNKRLAYNTGYNVQWPVFDFNSFGAIHLRNEFYN